MRGLRPVGWTHDRFRLGDECFGGVKITDPLEVENLPSLHPEDFAVTADVGLNVLAVAGLDHNAEIGGNSPTVMTPGPCPAASRPPSGPS